MLERIKNPNMLEVYDIFRSKGKIWIFQEYAGGGDLTSRCARDPVSDEEGKRWFKQVAEGVEYLHGELGICHRDIKTDNVLLDGKEDAKLTDFGFARRIEESQGLVKTVCGTLPYYSPELVLAAMHRGRAHKGVPHKEMLYSGFAADDWAMGVMLYAMLTTKWAFKFDPKGSRDGLRSMYLAMKTRAYQEKPYFKRLPRGARHLIHHLLDPDPTTRYTASKYAHHPWLTQSE